MSCPTVTKDCKVDCVLNQWPSSWSTCSKPCGTGTQTQTTTVKIHPKNGGATCPPLSRSRDCNTDPCPVDCIGSWSGWTPTCPTCGPGSQTRTFTITRNAAHGGTQCTASHGQKQTRNCNSPECPVHCVGSWVTGPCLYQNGKCQKKKTYKITQQANSTGNPCTTANGAVTYEQCADSSCPTCKGIPEWTACNETCASTNNGTTTGTFTYPTSEWDRLQKGQCKPVVFGWTNKRTFNQRTQPIKDTDSRVWYCNKHAFNPNPGTCDPNTGKRKFSSEVLEPRQKSQNLGGMIAQSGLSGAKYHRPLTFADSRTGKQALLSPYTNSKFDSVKSFKELKVQHPTIQVGEGFKNIRENMTNLEQSEYENKKKSCQMMNMVMIVIIVILVIGFFIWWYIYVYKNQTNSKMSGKMLTI